MDFNVKIFADGADVEGILKYYKNPIISGFTTNPTLMKKAGIMNYREFALEILEYIKDKPISFEVFSDDFNEMEYQALQISSWAENVYVKIPVTNTKGESSYNLIEKLSVAGVRLNVTAMMTYEQVEHILPALAKGPASFVSLFAGRIADTGIDPVPIIKQVLILLKDNMKTELIWASPREVFNIIQANEIGCHIITATSDILNKLNLIGRDLTEYSLDTVKMFYNDALNAGYNL